MSGVEKMGISAVGASLTAVVTDVAVIALVLLGHRSVVSIAVLLLIIQTTVMVITLFAYRRHLRIAFVTRIRELAAVFRGGVPFLATSVAYTLYVAADTLILTTLSSPTEVGWYGAVTQLVAMLLVVSTILGIAWLPRLSVHARHDPEALRRETRLIVRLGFVSAVPIAIGGCVIAGRLVVLVWGSSFAGASAPMSALILSLPATSVSRIVYQVLVARGLAAVWARVVGIAFLVNALANVGLILWFQRAGQSTALAASLCLDLTEVGMAIVAVWMIRRDLGWPMLGWAARVVLAGLVMGAAVVWVSGLPLVLVILIGAALFGVLALVLRLVSREELAAAPLLMRRMLGR